MTNTTSQTRLPRLPALLGALALTATACGSGGADVSAETDIVGIPAEFCDAVAELGTSIDSNASVTSRANAATAVFDLMPDDAPGYATSYFSAIAEATQLSANGSDASAAESDWANGEHLQVAAFLGAKCAEDEYASSPTFQAMVSTGLALQSTGVDPDTGNAQTATTQLTSDESDSAQSDPTQPDPGSTATTIDLGTVNNSVVYNMTEFVAGPAFATNAEENTIFESTQEVSNKNWVVVELLGETLANINTGYRAGVFFLIDPDGRSVSATELSDRFGDSIFQLDFNGRENQSAFALFETPELVSSLEGWQIQMLIGDEIPAFIPLSGPAAEVIEPIALPAVDGGPATADNIYTNVGCVSTLDIDVISATVSIETSYSNQLHRSRTTERFLTIEVDVTNTTDDSIDELCPKVPTSFGDPNLRLEVDGRKSVPVRLVAGTIDAGTTEAFVATYIISSDAAEISLLGLEDTQVLGTWQVDFPVLPGE